MLQVCGGVSERMELLAHTSFLNYYFLLWFAAAADVCGYKGRHCVCYGWMELRGSTIISVGCTKRSIYIFLGGHPFIHQQLVELEDTTPLM